MAYTVYSFGNIAELQNVLNAVAMVMNGGEYGTLLKAMSTFAILMFGTAAMAKARNMDVVTHVLGVTFFYLALFVPKQDVVIIDTMGQGPVTVSNVPLGIAMMTSLTSQMGYWLTNEYETVFSVPEDLQYQKNGMLFGASLYKRINEARPLDTTVYSNMSNFVKSCIYPELGSDPAKQDALTTSDDVWNLVGGTWTNPAYIMSVISGGSMITYTCPDAWTVIDQQLKDYIPQYEAQLGAIVNAGKVTTLTPDALLDAQISSTMNSIITSSKTAQDHLRQAMAVNLIKDRFMSTQSAWAVAQASAQYNTGAVTSGYMVNESLPLMRNMLETILIAMTPIVILMVVAAGMPSGLGILKHYFAACIWVQLWAPLYAVANNLAWQHTGKGIAAAMASYTSMTLQSQSGAISSVISSEAMISNLLYLIPVLSLIVAFAGVQSASGIASGLLQNMIASGNSAGAGAALGNSNVGNASWGNTNIRGYSADNRTEGNYQGYNASSGQINTAPTARIGAGQLTEMVGDGSSTSTFANGAKKTDLSGSVSNLGLFQGAVNSGLTSGFTQLSENSKSAAASAGVTSSSYVGTASKTAGDLNTSLTSGHGVSRDLAFSSDSSEGRAIRRLEAASKGDTAALNAASESGSKVSAGLGLRVAGSGGGVDRSSGVSSRSGYQSTEDYKNSADYANDMKTAKGWSDKVAASASSGSQRRMAQTISADLDQGMRAEQTRRSEMSNAARYSEMANQVASGGSAVSMNMANAYIESKGGDAGFRQFVAANSDGAIVNDISNFSQKKAKEMGVQITGSDKNAGMNTSAAGTPPSSGGDMSASYGQASEKVTSTGNANLKKFNGANSAPGIDVGGGVTLTEGAVKTHTQEGLSGSVDKVNAGQAQVHNTGTQTSKVVKQKEKDLGPTGDGYIAPQPIEAVKNFFSGDSNKGNPNK